MSRTWALVLATLWAATSCTVSNPSVVLPPSHSPSAATPIRFFHGKGVSFDFPASWTPHHFGTSSHFSRSIVDLSNKQPRLGEACPPHDNSKTCWKVVERLPPGGALVTWSANFIPAWTFAEAPGTPTTVGGRKAKVLVEGDKLACVQVRGDTSVDVVIERPSMPEGWYEMSACLRSPDVAAVESQVRSMLRTVTFG